MGPVECSFTKHTDIKNCYQCAKGLTNGNGHRYVQIGFADDCSTGAYVFLADWETRLIEKVKKLEME